MTDDWFVKTPIDQQITLVTEPYVDPFFSANIWLVRGAEADLLVDTGMGLRPLRPVLDLTPGKPVLALATHIHLDHVGGLHEFEHRLGPRESAEAFATMPDELTFAEEYREIERPVSRLPSPGWTPADYRLTPAPLTRILGEGDVIDLGDRRFTVLELPGHSPDGIGLFDEKNGVFFGGDAIYDDRLLDDMPGSDKAVYRHTMERLKTLPIRIGHGGHGPSFDARRMREIIDDYLAGAGA
ncbi:MBL fold metallo-hydrolase [Mesorhizobium sp. KR2-14]|uniref:MBL fold metallo-hydrolase n=1 Tax=Mesorhizobium sp. KR2-14 TaxID=3156610 RepID=UPI0032B4A274